MGGLQIDWYWAVIGMLSAYVLGSARGYKQTKSFAETIVQRTVSSLRPPAYRHDAWQAQEGARELADEQGERDAPQHGGRRRRNTRGGNDGE